jgi:hypothetical protein
MLGKLPRNEIIIKERGRGMRRERTKTKAAETEMPRRGSAADEERKFIYYIIVKQARYIRMEIGYHFERDGNRPILVRTRDFFPVLLPTIIIDVHYENERLAGGQLEQSTISLCGTKSNRQGYAIHQVHSQKSEKILHYTCERLLVVLYYCVCVCVHDGNPPAEYGREHDKYIIPAPVTIICSDDDEARFIVWGDVTILCFI